MLDHERFSTVGLLFRECVPLEIPAMEEDHDGDQEEGQPQNTPHHATHNRPDIRSPAAAAARARSRGGSRLDSLLRETDCLRYFGLVLAGEDEGGVDAAEKGCAEF